VNFRNLDIGKVGEFVTASQGPGLIQDMNVVSDEGPRGVPYFWPNIQRGRCENGADTETSIVNSGRVPVTALHFNRTYEDSMPNLRKIIER